MQAKICVIAGDGIGPEVMAAALGVLKRVGEKFGHDFEIKEALAGGAAWDKHGEHLPKETLEVAADCAAILFGSVGGPVDAQDQPKWRDCEKNSILGLRRHLKLFANLRPIKVFAPLAGISLLKPEQAGAGFDLLIIRELTGGIYFGEHKTENGVATDVMRYSETEVARIARVAFEAAMKRGKRLISVDKANVLDCSKLWRQVMEREAKNYPAVKLEHLYVDNAAMQLVKNPGQFDVMVTANLFGDILSDLGSVLAGSLGLLASASLNDKGFGLYEPSGGSAPDIAGKNQANPIAQILSLAMMLRHSLNLGQEAQAVETAVEQVLAEGSRTADIKGKMKGEAVETVVGTKEMGKQIEEKIERI